MLPRPFSVSVGDVLTKSADRVRQGQDKQDAFRSRGWRCNGDTFTRYVPLHETDPAAGSHKAGMKEPYNISIYPGSGTVDGKVGDHVLLAPAYNVTADEIENIANVTAGVVQDFFAKRV